MAKYRYGDFVYLCQSCGDIGGNPLVSAYNDRGTFRQLAIEVECRKAMCACDEHNKGKACKTKPCGGRSVLTCYDNLGGVFILQEEQNG